MSGIFITTGDFFNDAATYLAIAGTVPATLAFFTYTFGRPRTWTRRLLGWVMFLLFLSLMLVLGVILGRRLLGEYPGYGVVAFCSYTLLAVALWLVWLIIIRERHRGRVLGFVDNPPHEGEDSVSNTPITTATVPPIWFKAKRVIRTVLAVIIAIIVSGAAVLAAFAVFLPQVLPALAKILPPEAFAVLSTWVGFIVLLSGVITAIMANPTVNAFLTKFGAGSVPASAIVKSTPSTDAALIAQVQAAPTAVLPPSPRS